MRPQRRNSNILSSIAVVIVTLLVTGPANAEIIILATNAPSLKSGQILPDNANIKIPAGKSAQLILPSGKTKTLKGPFSGKVSSLARGEKTDAGLFKRLLDVVKKSGRDDGGFAAVRRVGKPGAMAAPTFSWTSIPADSTGTFCFAEGEQLSLMRPRNLSQNALTLRDMDSNHAATITWKPGQKSVHWPDKLVPKDKSRFAFQLADLGERPVEFRLVAPAARKNDDVLRTLHRRGCQKQLEAWLRARLRN